MLRLRFRQVLDSGYARYATRSFYLSMDVKPHGRRLTTHSPQRFGSVLLMVLPSMYLVCYSLGAD